MPLVSVTRARIRSLLFVPSFFLSASGAMTQAQSADGFLGGGVRPDGGRTFWTLTVWQDEEAMRSYMLSGAHRKVMPKFLDWCDEASVVHWEQESDQAPSWPAAEVKMRSQGHPSKLRKPSANHASMSFAAMKAGSGAPISRRA